jgi:hypothetical protein
VDGGCNGVFGVTERGDAEAEFVDGGVGVALSAAVAGAVFTAGDGEEGIILGLEVGAGWGAICC